MQQKRLKNTVELLYLHYMLRWQRTAPPDRHKGLLDGVSTMNSQTSRLGYVLVKIAAGDEERTYRLLAESNRREKGGHSRPYFSKDATKLVNPYPLSNGWFLEGCASLPQKHGFTQHLTKLGLSPRFVACLDDFIAGADISGYIPTLEEQEELLLHLEGQDACMA